MKFFLRFFPIAFAVLLSSCATQSTQLTTSNIAHPENWQADGVFAYRDQQQGFSAGYIWKNTNSHYDINIIGPLGAWRAVLQGDAKQAQLTTSDGKVNKSGDPQLLMQQNLGWSIPVNDLMHWLWGEPNPAQKGVVSKNAQGQVVAIQQNGWTIHYADYDEFQNKLVPNRIILTQDNKKVTVVIQHRSS